MWRFVHFTIMIIYASMLRYTQGMTCGESVTWHPPPITGTRDMTDFPLLVSFLLFILWKTSNTHHLPLHPEFDQS